MSKISRSLKGYGGFSFKLLALILIVSLSGCSSSVDKTEWSMQIKRSIPSKLCKGSEAISSCFDVETPRCISEMRKSTDVCLTRLTFQIPETLSGPYWKKVVSACAEREYFSRNHTYYKAGPVCEGKFPDIHGDGEGKTKTVAALTH